MQIILLRVGVDTGSGGTHGPLFRDGSFEYIPIPDGFNKTGVDSRTYGMTKGRQGRALIEYFPPWLQDKYRNHSIHFDPEFETFTYGDPTRPKRGLRKLERGDLLVFYAGLKGCEDCRREPALYIIGFFSVAVAGLARDFSSIETSMQFAQNFHVRNSLVFEDQKDRLVLVKGDKSKSRLLKKAVLISSVGKDRSGSPIHRLSPRMQRIFSDFGGHTSIQRSPPRQVPQEFIPAAADFVTSLK